MTQFEKDYQTLMEAYQKNIEFAKGQKKTCQQSSFVIMKAARQYLGLLSMEELPECQAKEVVKKSKHLLQRFLEWYKRNPAVFLDKDYEDIDSLMDLVGLYEAEVLEKLRYVESRAGRRLPFGRMIGISELASEMIPLPREKRGLQGYMGELGLKCEMEKLSDLCYESQCQVRLFRKLKKLKAGISSSEEEKEMKNERDRKILYVLRKLDQKSKIEDDSDRLFFHTVHCVFEVDLLSDNPILQYHTTRFYRGERRIVLEKMENLDWQDKAWKIQQTAIELEHQQSIGVGSNTVNLLVDKLAQKDGHAINKGGRL